MRINTRFNPTISGSLHVGHLYVALVNEVEAHHSGGKFIVRVDDTQPSWSLRIGKERSDLYYDEYQRQLSRFVGVDVWHRQSQMLKPEDIIGNHPILSKYPKLFENGTDVECLEYLLGHRWCGYNAAYTVDKVVWDYYEKVNCLIRGMDLLPEDNLYSHFVDEIGLPRVWHVHLPLLRCEGLGGAISKTIGTYTLEKQLCEFGVKGTLSILRECCLLDLEGDFMVNNIKEQPIVRGFIE